MPGFVLEMGRPDGMMGSVEFLQSEEMVLRGVSQREIRLRLEEREAQWLSPAAVSSREALRRSADPVADSGHRMEFAVDADRILHSMAYTRYIDKTQVFYLIRNDLITHRVLHVQLLSRIARNIGRLLRLNEDLIEAVALGHDLGHPPFGHDGEAMLDALCREHGLPPFLHNVQSVRCLEVLERKGGGLNLSLQVLDGILCHNGEILHRTLEPKTRGTFEEFDVDLRRMLESGGAEDLVPGTMEGTVVRLADVISYVGRDLADGVRINLVDREEVPGIVSERLGTTNGTIVYRLVEDLVENSLGGTGLMFGEEVGEALEALLDFNRKAIYGNPLIKTQKEKIRVLYRHLFDAYLSDIAMEREESEIFRDFLDEMMPEYRETTTEGQMVCDFMAGMTDDYFVKCATKLLMPEELPPRF